MKLAKTYEPKQYESDIYSLWEKSKAFEPTDNSSDEVFSLVCPPPNANAPLHIGFGLTMALEDIMARYNRMIGKSTLFIPGADHAGFETWVVYEKKLAKEGKTRFDFTREELYSQVWDFVAANRTNFATQFRHLGASVDWSKFTFALDDKVVASVYSTFKKMWDDKLIYRGERLVNFCTFHGTGFADVEVEYKEEKGCLWYIKYSVSNSDDDLIVATTRPETLLGDTALAVNPKDIRYKKFIGKTAKVPLTNREVPIIADNMVDMEFGTGVVKITPAHDFNDFEVAERHDLPSITIIDFHGKMTNEVPDSYRGLAVNEARQKVVEDLRHLDLLQKEEAHNHSVGHCYKCGTIIEPLLLEQWFVDMKSLSVPAIKALKKNEIIFYPETKKEQLITYLEGLKNWNISRQIAWGIPIPAFRNVDQKDDWIFDTRVGEETLVINDKTYSRDPDVFDTWFSSSSWPYVTLDYPSELSKKYYPLNIMETGGEILYPWVSRMIMLGIYVTGHIPFKSVYIHGYVMAEDGSKMSKSVGNTVNLDEVIDKFGSDAFRMGIINGRSPAINRGYDQPKIEAARNFCNKLWNIARYSETIFEDNFKTLSPKPNSLADHWILEKLQLNINSITSNLDKYRFSEAYNAVYHFVWDDVADWYIESTKIDPNPQLLFYVLESILKLVHPFAPFISETIWQTLNPDTNKLLINQEWPNSLEFNKSFANQFSDIQDLIVEIRNITSALDVKSPKLYYTNEDFIKHNAEFIKKFAKLSGVEELDSGQGMHLTQTKFNCWLDIDIEIAQKYKNKLIQKKLVSEETIKQLETRLSNKSYISNAPEKIIRQSRDQLASVKNLRSKIDTELSNFESATKNS